MKNKLLSILKSIGIILLTLSFNNIFFAILNIKPTNISETEYIIYLTLSNLSLILIFFLIYKKTLIEDFKKFTSKTLTNIEISIKYWITGLMIMLASNLIITFILNKGLAGNEEDVRNLIDSFPLFMIFNTIIYAPLIEELTFRKSIKDAIPNKWLYILTSGLVFGLLHIISYITTPIDLVYLIPYGALGTTFALLYYKTDNIFSTITIHSIHNLLAIIIYLLGASL